MFLLTKQYDNKEDGYVNIAVFNTRQKLEEYVKETYPEHRRDNEGNYYNESKYSFTTKEYLVVTTVDIIE